MDINAMLCDFAQTAEGKLFVSGGGVNTSWVQPQPPHIINIGIAAVINVPYTATNQPHQFGMSLVDADGQQVTPWVPEGAPAPEPLEDVGMSFNLGRPPGLIPGQSQAYPIAINASMGLPKLGTYNFVLSIDGTEVSRLPLLLTVMQAPGLSFGPATPGPIGR